MQRTLKICLAAAILTVSVDALEINSELERGGRRRRGGRRGGRGRSPSADGEEREEKTCTERQEGFTAYLTKECEEIDEAER